MADIYVRDLSARAVTRLKRRARMRGRSLQAEVRDILEGSAGAGPLEARRLADRIRRKLRGRRLSDSAHLIREDRTR